MMNTDYEYRGLLASTWDLFRGDTSNWEDKFFYEKIIQKYHRNKKTVIFISHDINLVARLAPRIIVLNSGTISFDGSRDDLFQNHTILKQSGFYLPEVTEFMRKVKRDGYPVDTNLYTVKEAKKELKKYYRL